jgi:hypothetical protein
MKKRVIGAAAVLALAYGAAATAQDDHLARFDGGIGVIPVSAAAAAGNPSETVNRNVVRGVQPPGQIWVIAGLKADVRVDGRINVQGRGLLLGGGNGIGSNAGASVFATLMCEATGIQHSTPLSTAVALEPNGDFRIDDMLTTVPAECPSPVLLIRNAGNQAWFAAGIPKL